MSDISAWLEKLGLSEYQAVFAENEIDFEVLPQLTEEDIQELGLPIGPRRKILTAVAALKSGVDSIDLRRPPEPETSPESPSAPRAERRQLTVMFIDLVGSTALSERLDPEDLSGIIRHYRDCCVGIVSRFEGYVAKFMGDGILVYFGYPQAHEHDAERAVYAGLDIVRAISDMEIAGETGWRVRVGIATGLVVVGEMIGSGSSQEHTVVGETPNLAARLQGVAAPGQVVIAQSTQALAGAAFDYEDLGLHELKGISEPVRAWQVVQERDIDQEEAPAAAKLIGRDEELGLLIRAWEQSQAGAGQLVLLSGEAGLGKSALVEALSAQAKAQGGLRVTLRCSPYHVKDALYPVIQHLQRVLGWQRGDAAASRLDKLEQTLARYRFPDAQTVPLLATLFSLTLPEERYPAVLSAPPEQQRHQTLETIVAWTLEEAERQRVLQVWEDLQWADPSTLALLGLFAERCDQAAVMNLLTYRPEFTPPWEQRSAMSTLTLTRLGRGAIEAIVRRVAGGKTLPEALVEQIVVKADGVPLYAEELTKTVLASNRLRVLNGHYELIEPEASVTVPATLQESLMARLDRLGPAKSVAQLGAAIGEHFTPELLQTVAAEDDTTVRQALEQLVAAELLAQRGHPPHTTYQFRQGLIREVAYESLLRQRRQALHGAIAQAIEALESEHSEEQAAMLAYHYGHSRHFDKSIYYALRAGDYAVRLHARTEASSYYRQALATARDWGAAPEAQRGQIEAILKLAAVSASREDLARDQDNLPKAKALAEALDDQPRLAQALYWLGRVYWARGESVAAAEWAEQSLAIADALGDEVLAAPPINLLGRHYAIQGNVTRGSKMLVRSTEQMRHIGNTAEEATAAGFAGMAYAWAGDFIQGMAYAAHGLQLAQQLDNPFAEAAAYLYRGVVYLQRGAWADAVADLDHGRGIAEAAGDHFRSYIIKAYAGEALTGTGQPEQARKLLGEAIAFAKEIGTQFQLSVAKRNLAAALMALDEPGKAWAVCQEAITVADEAGELLVKSRACRLLVELCYELGRSDQEAEQTLLDAIRVQQEFGAEPELARSYLTYSQLLHRQGKRNDVKEYYDRATAMFERMGMGWDLAKAERPIQDRPA